jgi:aryl-alcohol dehydrogenase-like predicted oxidoreductase
MNYRTLGNTGTRVSPLCLGAMMPRVLVKCEPTTEELS